MTKSKITNKKIITFLLLSIFMGSCTSSHLIKDITVSEANKLIQSNKVSSNFVIIDVRTAKEYANGHIENAINLDYYSDFKNEISNLDKSKTYLIYCQNGTRSTIATKTMEGLGFKEVYNMREGFSQWEKEYPIVK